MEDQHLSELEELLKNTARERDYAERNLRIVRQREKKLEEMLHYWRTLALVMETRLKDLEGRGEGETRGSGEGKTR